MLNRDENVFQAKAFDASSAEYISVMLRKDAATMIPLSEKLILPADEFTN